MSSTNAAGAGAGAGAALPLPLYATAANGGPASLSPKRTASSSSQASSGGPTTSSVTLQRKRQHRLRGGWGSGKHSGSYSSFLNGDGESGLGYGHPSSRYQHGRGASLPTYLSSLLFSRSSPLAIFRPSNLTARARTTNLAVLLLLLTLILSLLYNIRFYLHEHPLKAEQHRLPLSIRATLPLPNKALVGNAAAQAQAQAVAAAVEKARRRIEGVKQVKEEARYAVEDSHVGVEVFKAGNAGGSATSAGPVYAPVDLSALDHLVMVPGHAVFKGRLPEEADSDDSWVLEPMQRGGSVKTFLKHIMKGAELVTADPTALLIFSGGQTRTNAQETEGDSYYRLAELLDLYRQYGTPKQPVVGRDDTPIATPSKEADTVALATSRTERGLFPRATTEQYALDSFQNLLFSICRFKEMTGRYPARITVVGFGMKRTRFTDIHRHSLKFPLSAFTYVGIDDEGETGQSYLGEKEYGLKPYSEDIYGCKGFLLGKRRARNPHRRIHPYHVSNPALVQLLEFCPVQGRAVYPGRLPWEE